MLKSGRSSLQRAYNIAFYTLAQGIIEIGPEKVEGMVMDNREKRLATMAQNYLLDSFKINHV
jgi:hypothetical protein